MEKNLCITAQRSNKLIHERLMCKKSKNSWISFPNTENWKTNFSGEQEKHILSQVAFCSWNQHQIFHSVWLVTQVASVSLSLFNASLLRKYCALCSVYLLWIYNCKQIVRGGAFSESTGEMDLRVKSGRQLVQSQVSSIWTAPKGGFAVFRECCWSECAGCANYSAKLQNTCMFVTAV